MNDETTMFSLVNQLAQVKSEQNILGALAIYHPEAEMIAPSFGSIARGSAEIEQQLKVFFSLFPDYEVDLKQYAFNETVMLVTGEASVTLNVPGKVCPRIQLPVFIEFHFDEQRISKEVFYFDAGMVCRRSGVSQEELLEATRTYQSWRHHILDESTGVATR